MKKILTKWSSIISFALSVILVVCSLLIFRNTSDYAFEKLSYDLYDYNKITYVDNYSRKVLSISRNNSVIEEKENNSELNYLFYYFSRNTYACKDFRYISQKAFTMKDSTNNTNYSIKVLTQPTFYATERNGKFLLDYRKFASLFNSNKGVATYDFCFVSEHLAKKILLSHGITVTDENKLDAYRKLIRQEKDELNIRLVESEERNYSIVGVLDSKYGSYSRVQQISEMYNADFILAYTPLLYSNQYKMDFDIDLKINPHGNKTVFKEAIETIKEKNYSISIKEEENNRLVVNEKFTKDFLNSVLKMENDKKYSILLLLVLLILYGLNFFCELFNRKNPKKIIGISFILFNLLFVVYGIIAYFSFIYPLVTMILLLCYLFYYLTTGRKIYEEYIKKSKERIN